LIEISCQEVGLPGVDTSAQGAQVSNGVNRPLRFKQCSALRHVHADLRYTVRMHTLPCREHKALH